MLKYLNISFSIILYFKPIKNYLVLSFRVSSLQ